MKDATWQVAHKYLRVEPNLLKVNYKLLAKKVQRHVTDFYEEHKGRQLLYHNIGHTKYVERAVMKIGEYYGLSEANCFIVTAAAWFHDVGHYCKDSSNHEEKGAGMASQFLWEAGADETTITAVRNCILATKMPQSPTTLLEEIVCDADLFHLGTDDFEANNKLLRKECEKLNNQIILKKDWRKSTIRLLQSHHYYTEYCNVLLNKKKQENLEKLLQKDAKEPLEIIPVNKNEEDLFIKEGEEHVSKKPEKPSRGIETMFRITAANHQRLSDMADRKAHIMISVNSIVISVVIGLLIRRLDAAHNLILPTLILLVTSVVVIIFSVLATRPKIPTGYFTADELHRKSVNLLFFGNFYKMDFEPYYEGMQKVMGDKKFLYESLIRDLHSQGVILGNKYKFLRISYTIFMFALVTSILAFAIAIIFFD